MVEGPPPLMVGQQRVKVYIEPKTKTADYGQGRLRSKNKKKMSTLERLSDQQIEPNRHVAYVMTHEGA
jgi:hypothetical protein